MHPVIRDVAAAHLGTKAKVIKIDVDKTKRTWMHRKRTSTLMMHKTKWFGDNQGS
jgi:hypothetical protein